MIDCPVTLTVGDIGDAAVTQPICRRLQRARQQIEDDSVWQ